MTRQTIENRMTNARLASEKTARVLNAPCSSSHVNPVINIIPGSRESRRWLHPGLLISALHTYNNAPKLAEGLFRTVFWPECRRSRVQRRLTVVQLGSAYPINIYINGVFVHRVYQSYFGNAALNTENGYQDFKVSGSVSNFKAGTSKDWINRKESLKAET